VNTNGTAVRYSTYLGGASEDHAQGIALDQTTTPATVWITGFTQSTNFPSTNVPPPLTSFVAADPVTNTFNHLNNRSNITTRSDAFVAKISPFATNLTFSMFLGGSNDESGLAIA